MQKWSYFSMGIMAGIIAVLLTVVVMQNREPAAHAVVQADNNGQGLVVATGASTQNQNDVLWVLQKHPPSKLMSFAADSKLNKSEHLTLACYQVTRNGGEVKLVSVRNISFDLDLVDYKTEKPLPRDVVKDLADAYREIDKKNKEPK